MLEVMTIVVASRTAMMWVAAVGAATKTPRNCEPSIEGTTSSTMRASSR